jgi:hypothetical protein
LATSDRKRKTFTTKPWWPKKGCTTATGWFQFSFF